MITDIDRAWAAGFFEGEGSVRISKPALRNWGSLNVDVPNTDQSMVDFFAERWGGSVKQMPEKGNRRTYWRWRLAARQAEAFLRDIQPFLRSDRVRQRVAHGLAFQAQKELRGRGEEYRERQWIAYWWMAELNRRGVRT